MKAFDIHARIFEFVIVSLKQIRYVPQTLENKVIINQVIRSITSVGANDQEADGVSSKRDCIHCYTVVRKELKETRYWFAILGELNPKLKEKLSAILQESDELIKIVSKIISNAAISAKIS